MDTYQYKYGDRPLDGYTIQRAAGRGGFGEVYYAISDGGRQVALKAIQSYEQIELRGISQCMNLKSPHLVTVFDVKHNDQGRPFVIMEYVSGPSLADMLKESPGGLGTQKAAFFLREIGKGLSFLHECGIVHRDLKPGNIFYENGYVKIGDYGLTKLMTTSPHISHTITVGTVHYMAPEVGTGRYDHRVDIYALGIVLYEVLTGRLPFNGSDPVEILVRHATGELDLGEVEEPFANVLRKALAKDPAERYQSVQPMVEDVFGAAHVRNSVSQFAPEGLSVVAEHIAQKMRAEQHEGGPEQRAVQVEGEQSPKRMERAQSEVCSTELPPLAEAILKLRADREELVRTVAELTGQSRSGLALAEHALAKTKADLNVREDEDLQSLLESFFAKSGEVYVFPIREWERYQPSLAQRDYAFTPEELIAKARDYHDERCWKFTKNSRDKVLYKNYITAVPYGRHVSEACRRVLWKHSEDGEIKDVYQSRATPADAELDAAQVYRVYRGSLRVVGVISGAVVAGLTGPLAAPTSAAWSESLEGTAHMLTLEVLAAIGAVLGVFLMPAMAWRPSANYQHRELRTWWLGCERGGMCGAFIGGILGLVGFLDAWRQLGLRAGWPSIAGLLVGSLTGFFVGIVTVGIVWGYLRFMGVARRREYVAGLSAWRASTRLRATRDERCSHHDDNFEVLLQALVAVWSVGAVAELIAFIVMQFTGPFINYSVFGLLLSLAAGPIALLAIAVPIGIIGVIHDS